MKLKTRTNQPVYYKLPVSSNIKQLSDGMLNSLKVGDVVQKKTGNQKHCYVVTYKEEKHGICLTYCDASVVETVSYDYVGSAWVYNSTDVTHLGSVTPQQVVSALVGQDVVVKTLEQSEANWKYPTEHISIGGINSSLTTTLVFGRLQKINQSLHLIFLIKIENETEASVNGGNPTVIFSKEYIPEDIQKKIIGFKGISLFDQTGNHQFCCNVPTIKGTIASDDSLNINASGFIASYLDLSGLTMQISMGGLSNIAAGGKIVVEGRVELDLI